MHYDLVPWGTKNTTKNMEMPFLIFLIVDEFCGYTSSCGYFTTEFISLTTIMAKIFIDNFFFYNLDETNN